jgi:uncharacterized membrane protein
MIFVLIFREQITVMTELKAPKQRVQSIDLLRGIVIVIMALDHVRDYFHIEGATGDPTNMQTTTPLLFFTRFITHFCAPVFVFLAGTSGFLQGLRKSKKELSVFLVQRGLWLVFAELVIVTFGITFDPGYHVFILQVIWAIGVSMIILGLLVWLPFSAILFYGIVVVLLHNMLDAPEAAAAARREQLPLWWKLIHSGAFIEPLGGGRRLLGLYAFVPWSGVMALGYCFGKLFQRDVDPAWRKRTLVYIGSGVILLFIILRAINDYGDPRHWSEQPRGTVYSFLSFFNTTKYPPSLLYLSMTLGPAILFLAVIENVQNSLTRFFITFGRVPFFFYILHFYLMHVICIIFFYAEGYGKGDIVPEAFVPLFFRPNEFGYSLWIVYAIWIAIVLMLYPLCKKYDRYKTATPKWWTSYV